MRYTQTFVDVILKANIRQGLSELTQNFDDSICEMEKCMEQFQIGLKVCEKKQLENTYILWNYAGFVNMCAMELKIHMKATVSSTNEWESRTHIKAAYMLIHSFYEAYDIIHKDYNQLTYHQRIGDDFIKSLENNTHVIREFRKAYLKHIKIIRNNNAAHLLPNVVEQIDTMERFQLSQTIEVLLKFGNILNMIGGVLNAEIKYVLANLDSIR